jgi:DNA-binding phage protein
MAIETFDFDPADFLTSEEGIEEFLLATSEERDPESLAYVQTVVARARQKLANRAPFGEPLSKGRYGGWWRGALKGLR